MLIFHLSSIFRSGMIIEQKPEKNKLKFRNYFKKVLTSIF